MKKTATKLGLTFDNSMNKFQLSESSYKRNILTGKINNHSIEMFDFYDYRQSLNPFNGLNYYCRKLTVLEVDGQKRELRGLLNRLPSVSKIKSVLGNII